MCPYLVYDDDGTGVCSIRGLNLSPGKVSGFCETSVYVECDTYGYNSFDEDDNFEIGD